MTEATRRPTKRPTASPPAITATGLLKSYGEHPVTRPGDSPRTSPPPSARSSRTRPEVDVPVEQRQPAEDDAARPARPARRSWRRMRPKVDRFGSPRRSAAGLTAATKLRTGSLVLDGIDLAIAEGSIFALLGPNGAGKTTLVNILSTLIGADGGTASVAGHDVAKHPDEVRGEIGVTGQFSAVDGLLSGRENLILTADLHHLGKQAGRRRADELLARFDLTEAAGKPAASYSGGMRRRLDLAMTLVGDPAVIFLDEPTTGLDPRSRRTMWEIIRGLAADGVTIFLTTQQLEEADQLADRIAVLDHGRIVAEGSPDELKRRVPGGHVEVKFADPGQLDAASRLLSAIGRDDDALTLQVAGDGGVRALRALLNQLDAAAVEVQTVTVHTPDLDDVFFALTGKKAEA